MKKSYGSRSKRHRQRNWHLQQLDREVEGGAGVDKAGEGGAEADYTSFLEDLEEDPTFRRNISMFLSEYSLVPSPTLGRWVWLPAYSKLGQHYVSGPRSGPAM